MSRATIELATTATADGLSSIALKICSPPSPIAAAVFAHGGCFSDGCSQSHPAVTEALAGIGIASVSSTYRQGAARRHPYPTASTTSPVSLSLLGVTADAIGLSSGGWHALTLSRTIALRGHAGGSPSPQAAQPRSPRGQFLEIAAGL